MRISDWSSDVCSSDLITLGGIQAFIQYVRQFNQPLTQIAGMYNTMQSGIASAERVFDLLDAEEEQPELPATLPTGVDLREGREIGSASGRERVCQYV